MPILISNESMNYEETQISPLLDPSTSSIIVFVVGMGLAILIGVLGIFTNVANICVYLKMGINETTNMKFFTLSVSDLLVCMSTVVSQTATFQMQSISPNSPSKYSWMEVCIAATYVAFPCLGCSAWTTAFLSVERYLCIATPLKVKDILTPQRTRGLILIMVTYQSVFLVLFFVNPGPPYHTNDFRRLIYYNCSFSAPTLICFLIVSTSTVLLILRLRQSLEWRTESLAAQSSKNLKEKKATRSVIAICTIFIACFTLNIGVMFVPIFNQNFSHLDPYLSTLFLVVYSFSTFFQIVCSSVNIFVYYSMSTKYRKVFTSLFYRNVNENS